MDKVDVGIIRELFYPGPHQWNVRESFATIGRNLGIDEETVRQRIRRLEADGVLKGWDLLVNPSLLGRTFNQVIVDVAPGAKADLVQRFHDVDGVYWIFESLGTGFGVVGLVEPGPAVDRFRRLVESMTGAPGLTAPIAMPPASVELDATDWRLVQALRVDVRDTFDNVAGRVGASEKTVRRRLQRLIEGRAVFLNGRVGFSEVKGSLSIQAKVWVETPEARAAAEKYLMTIENRTFFNFGTDVPQLSFWCDSAATIEEVRAALAAISGVGTARVEILLRRHTLPEWLDEQIAKRADGD